MDKLKSSAEVLKHRVVAGCFFGLHATNCVLFFLAASKTSGHPGELPFPVAYFPIFLLGILGSLYYFFDLCFFKWDYSKLGKLEAQDPDLSEPLLVASSTYGAVGFLRGSVPFFEWQVYPEGVKVKMMFVGEAFVRVEEMRSVSWSALTHSSKVVRGPLRMPGTVADSVKELLV